MITYGIMNKSFLLLFSLFCSFSSLGRSLEIPSIYYLSLEAEEWDRFHYLSA